MPKLTPNYLTTDTQGRVSASFSGHVAASGVDLPASPIFNTIASDDKVRWLNTVSKLPAAEIGAFDAANARQLSLYSYGRNAPGPQQSATTWLGTIDETSSINQAALRVIYAPTGSPTSSMDVFCSDIPSGLSSVVTLLDGLGKSGFIQVGGAARKLRVMAGSILCNTPAGVAVGATFNVVATPPELAGLTPTAVVAVVNFGGGLVGSVPIECVAAMAAGTFTVNCRNNAGFVLGASTMMIGYLAVV